MNVFVDTSVWIDYFRGTINPKTDKLDELLTSQPLIIGDLILAEILQGFQDEREFREVEEARVAVGRSDTSRRAPRVGRGALQAVGDRDPEAVEDAEGLVVGGAGLGGRRFVPAADARAVSGALESRPRAGCIGPTR